LFNRAEPLQRLHMNTFANKPQELLATETSHLDDDNALDEFAANFPGNIFPNDDATDTYDADTGTVPEQHAANTANAELNGERNSQFKTAAATSPTPASSTRKFFHTIFIIF